MTQPAPGSAVAAPPWCILDVRVRPKDRECIEAALWVDEGILDGTFEDWAISIHASATDYRIMGEALRVLRARPRGSYRVFSSSGKYSTVRIALVDDREAGIQGQRNKLWLKLTAGELAQLIERLDERADWIERGRAGAEPSRRAVNGVYLDANVGPPAELPSPPDGGKAPGSKGSRR
jgi:hypothetical protein